MSINSIINAEKYSEELDKVFVQKSVTGFFADNALRTKFVGAKTVIIPEIDFQGLSDYDRNNGYSKGAITVTNTSHTMTMDRARSLQIDREDMDESGIANLAGKVLGEYVRTKVVPECDAYVLSKLSKIAISNNNTVDCDYDVPLSALITMINEIRMKAGYDAELVAFIDARMYAHLQCSSEFLQMATNACFKHGDLDLTFTSFNDVPLIPVVRDRMKTDFVFFDNEEGGFYPAGDARDIFMLVCPKNAVHLVKKTENMRVFTPEQNLDADAYKFDYRIYYDAFVNNSDIDFIYAWVSPLIIYVAQSEDTRLSKSNQVTIGVQVEDYESFNYQWYKCKDMNGRAAVALEGEKEASINIIGAEYDVGDHYFFLRGYVDEYTFKDSKPIKVTIY